MYQATLPKHQRTGPWNQLHKSRVELAERSFASLGCLGVSCPNSAGRTGPPLVANSLCRGPEKRTMHEPDVQVGNSGPPLDEEKSNMKMFRAYAFLFAAAVASMGVSSLAPPCFAQDANTGNGLSFAGTKQVLGLE